MCELYLAQLAVVLLVPVWGFRLIVFVFFVVFFKHFFSFQVALATHIGLVKACHPINFLVFSMIYSWVMIVRTLRSNAVFICNSEWSCADSWFVTAFLSSQKPIYKASLFHLSVNYVRTFDMRNLKVHRRLWITLPEFSVILHNIILIMSIIACMRIFYCRWCNYCNMCAYCLIMNVECLLLQCRCWILKHMSFGLNCIMYLKAFSNLSVTSLICTLCLKNRTSDIFSNNSENLDSVSTNFGTKNGYLNSI